MASSSAAAAAASSSSSSSSAAPAPASSSPSTVVWPFIARDPHTDKPRRAEDWDLDILKTPLKFKLDLSKHNLHAWNSFKAMSPRFAGQLSSGHSQTMLYVAHEYFALGAACDEAGLYTEARKCYQQDYFICRDRVKNVKEGIASLVKIGDGLVVQHKFFLAVQYYEQALSDAVRSNNYADRQSAFVSLGLACQKWSDHVDSSPSSHSFTLSDRSTLLAQALSYFRLSLERAKSIPQQATLTSVNMLQINAYTNLATAITDQIDFIGRKEQEERRLPDLKLELSESLSSYYDLSASNQLTRTDLFGFNSHSFFRAALVPSAEMKSLLREAKRCTILGEELCAPEMSAAEQGDMRACRADEKEIDVQDDFPHVDVHAARFNTDVEIGQSRLRHNHGLLLGRMGLYEEALAELIFSVRRLNVLRPLACVDRSAAFSLYDGQIESLRSAVLVSLTLGRFPYARKLASQIRTLASRAKQLRHTPGSTKVKVFTRANDEQLDAWSQIGEDTMKAVEMEAKYQQDIINIDKQIATVSSSSSSSSSFSSLSSLYSLLHQKRALSLRFLRCWADLCSSGGDVLEPPRSALDRRARVQLSIANGEREMWSVIRKQRATMAEKDRCSPTNSTARELFMRECQLVASLSSSVANVCAFHYTHSENPSLEVRVVDKYWQLTLHLYRCLYTQLTAQPSIEWEGLTCAFQAESLAEIAEMQADAKQALQLTQQIIACRTEGLKLLIQCEKQEKGINEYLYFLKHQTSESLVSDYTRLIKLVEKQTEVNKTSKVPLSPLPSLAALAQSKAAAMNQQQVYKSLWKKKCEQHAGDEDEEWREMNENIDEIYEGTRKLPSDTATNSNNNSSSSSSSSAQQKKPNTTPTPAAAAASSSSSSSSSSAAAAAKPTTATAASPTPMPSAPAKSATPAAAASSSSSSKPLATSAAVTPTSTRPSSAPSHSAATTTTTTAAAVARPAQSIAAAAASSSSSSSSAFTRPPSVPSPLLPSSTAISVPVPPVVSSASATAATAARKRRRIRIREDGSESQGEESEGEDREQQQQQQEVRDDASEATNQIVAERKEREIDLTREEKTHDSTRHIHKKQLLNSSSSSVRAPSPSLAPIVTNPSASACSLCGSSLLNSLSCSSSSSSAPSAPLLSSCPPSCMLLLCLHSEELLVSVRRLRRDSGFIDSLVARGNWWGKRSMEELIAIIREAGAVQREAIQPVPLTLPPLSALLTLDLSYCAMDGSHHAWWAHLLLSLPSLPRLRHLLLNRTPLGGWCVSHLSYCIAHCAQLQTLEMEGCKHLSGNEPQAGRERDGSEEIALARALTSNPNLRELSVAASPLSTLTLVHLLNSCATSLPLLRTLSLSYVRIMCYRFVLNDSCEQFVTHDDDADDAEEEDALDANRWRKAAADPSCSPLQLMRQREHRQREKVEEKLQFTVVAGEKQLKLIQAVYEALNTLSTAQQSKGQPLQIKLGGWTNVRNYLSNMLLSVLSTPTCRIRYLELHDSDLSIAQLDRLTHAIRLHQTEANSLEEVSIRFLREEDQPKNNHKMQLALNAIKQIKGIKLHS